VSVWWKGVQLDERSAEMMNEVVRLCPGITISPSQGSWSGADASAGTHSGAGAIDLKAVNLSDAHRQEIVLQMRIVGWAAWLRTPAQSDWPYHIHGIAVGCSGLSTAAADQVDDFLSGRNGLASGAPDDGPRDFDHVGITWEEYCGRQRPADKEEDSMNMVIRDRSGSAYLLFGASAASGLYDNSVIEEIERHGLIPVVDMDDKSFNAALKGRDVRAV